MSNYGAFGTQVDNEMDIITNMSRTTGVKYSDEQLDILKHHGGMCILACAGSGKTSILNHLIGKRIQSGEISNTAKLLCTTFSKSGADELEQRLDSLLKQLGIKSNAQVKTLHSVYYSLLKNIGYNIKIVDNSTKMRYIREACKETNVLLEEEDFVTLDGIFGFQINNLMSDEVLFKSYAYTLREKIPLNEYSKIRTAFNSKKQNAGCMDFDDMQLWVFTLLKSEAYGEDLQRYCKSLWEYIYMDEAQDISKIQFEILKMIISDPNKLVFIGDDDQCIYQWRGADPSIILNICAIYTELTMFKLTTNYRCYGDIVRRAADGIKFNISRSDKTMIPFNEGGKINVCDIGQCNIHEMSKYAYKYIKELVIDKGVNPKDIAVLSRNNQHLTVLGNMLFRDGIYCKTSDDMKFTKCSIYRLVNGILFIGQNTTNGNLTSENLWKCCAYMQRSISKEIGNIQNTYGISLKDTLGLLLTNTDRCYDVKWNNPGIKIQSMDILKCNTIASRLNEEGFDSLKTVYKLLDNENSSTCTVALLKMFLLTKLNFFFKSYESSRFAEGFVSYICTLIEEMGISNTMRYLNSIEQFENGYMAVMSPMVTLSTMHSAKGREWKYVIIFADDNVSFPSFQNIQQCISDGVPISDIMSMIDENRRLHYVAMTRAKEQLMIFGYKGNLSVYTLEALGVMNFDRQNNTNIITMAQHGIYKELIEQAETTIFDKSSQYYCSIDIGDLDTKIEKEYNSSKI